MSFENVGLSYGLNVGGSRYAEWPEELKPR